MRRTFLDSPAGLGGRLLLAAVVAIGLLSGGLAGSVGATSIIAKWQAKVGAGGVNGTATITVFAPGTGTLAISLKGLGHSTTYTETVQKGTCGSPSTTRLTLPPFKTTSAGNETRTNSLSASQIAAVNKSGEVIRFVAGTHTFCGAFAKVALPPPVVVPTVAATVTVGLLPEDVAVTPTAVYVANSDNSISKIDPTTNSILSAIPLGDPGTGFPAAIAVGDDGNLWVADQMFDASNKPVPGEVLRVDPASGQVKATITWPAATAGKLPVDLVTSPGAAWVATYGDDTITRIDTATNQITDLIVVANAAPVGLAYDFGNVWVTAEAQGKVYPIDPTTRKVGTPVATVPAPEGVATGAGALWVAHYGHAGQADGVLSRIDSASGQVVRTIPVGTNPLWVAFGGGFVWVAMSGEPTIVQVGPATNAVIGRVTVSGPSEGIAASGHSVWVVQPNEAGLSAKPPVPGTATRINF
jgi:hypothetical protein